MGQHYLKWVAVAAFALCAGCDRDTPKPGVAPKAAASASAVQDLGPSPEQKAAMARFVKMTDRLAKADERFTKIKEFHDASLNTSGIGDSMTLSETYLAMRNEDVFADGMKIERDDLSKKYARVLAQLRPGYLRDCDLLEGMRRFEAVNHDQYESMQQPPVLKELQEKLPWTQSEVMFMENHRVLTEFGDVAGENAKMDKMEADIVAIEAMLDAFDAHSKKVREPLREAAANVLHKYLQMSLLRQDCDWRLHEVRKMGLLRFGIH